MKIIIVFSILLFCINLEGQESKLYLKYKNKIEYQEGYILNLDSTKSQGLIYESIMDETQKYWYVIFVSKEGQKFKYYPTSDILGYGYSIHKYEAFYDSFYEIVQKGQKACLYKKQQGRSYYGSRGSFSTDILYPNETFFVKKTFEKELVEVKKKDFEIVFSEYFGDCNSLKEKIYNQELSIKDIQRIVSDYNWCK